MASGQIAFLRAAGAASQGWWTPSLQVLERVAPHRVQVKVRAVEIGEDGRGDVWSGTSLWIDVDERNETELTGVITEGMEREGLREGDRITVPLDRILDLVFVDDEGCSLLNEERARSMIGKRIISGVTLLSPAGDVVEMQQLVGIVSAVTAEGIRLELDDGATFDMPPDCSNIEEAMPGDYRLRANGHVVVDPDFTTEWTLQPLPDDVDWMERIPPYFRASRQRPTADG